MVKNRFKQSQCDHTLFVKNSLGGKVIALIVYVDDIVLTVKEFEIIDLGSLKYFLGIEVERFKDGIFFSQWQHILDLLIEIGMLVCKEIETPMDSNLKLSGEPTDKERYQRMVGKLI